MPLQGDHVDVGRRVSAALRFAAKTLAAELSDDELDACLMRWGIVLAVLGADVLDGVVTLLEGDNQRSASMLSRPLADYNVRLRYYYIQALPLRRKLVARPERREAITSKIHAIRDWRNSQTKFLLNSNLYDPSTWTDRARVAIEDVLVSGASATDSRFSEMCRFLIDNEARERGVPTFLRDRVEWETRHYLPAWVMQSCFLHGDQAIITDVIEHDDDGIPTHHVHMQPPYDASLTILHSAILQATGLLRSTAFVRPSGWMMEAVSLRNEAGALFLRDRPDLS